MQDEEFVIPEDVIIMPVTDLSDSLRGKLQHDLNDYALTRINSRVHTKIISVEVAELLDQFRKPKSLINAIIDYSSSKNIIPEDVLNEAGPVLMHLVKMHFLAPADSDKAKKTVQSFQQGELIGSYEVLHCVQMLEDSELYKAKTPEGNTVALKLTRLGQGNQVHERLEHEAQILNHLDGKVNPPLLASASFQGRSYIAIEWFDGIPSHMLRKHLEQNPQNARLDHFSACCNVLAAYQHLHEQGVIHSDVHPQNVLISAQGEVKLIDYGFSRVEGTQLRPKSRGGVSSYYEPELAQAMLKKVQSPPSSFLGEQYAIAALLYTLLAGTSYLAFSPKREDMLRQIVQEDPLPFSMFGSFHSKDVEAVLLRALNKNPNQRFHSVGEFCTQFHEAAPMAHRGQRESSSNKLGDHSQDRLLVEFIDQAVPGGELLASVFRSAPSCNVNFGAAGIAYVLYRLSCSRADPKLLSYADVWCNHAAANIKTKAAFHNKSLQLTHGTIGDVSLYHTASGVHCVQALISIAMGDNMSQQAAVNDFIMTSQYSCENIDLTLGRSGNLLGASILLESLADIKTDNPMLNRAPLYDFGSELMESILAQALEYGEIAVATDMKFLGIAHGWAGVVYAAIRWCQAAGLPVPGLIKNRLEELPLYAENLEHGARWPRSVDTKDYVVGWCNGSAGFVHLWTEAFRALQDPKYLDLAEKAAWDTWENSETDFSLCCGYAGRAYALINASKYLNDVTWLDRAIVLAKRATSTASGYSLYRGSAGVVALLADLAQPESSCMPLFGRESD